MKNIIVFIIACVILLAGCLDQKKVNIVDDIIGEEKQHIVSTGSEETVENAAETTQCVDVEETTIPKSNDTKNELSETEEIIQENEKTLTQETMPHTSEMETTEPTQETVDLLEDEVTEPVPETSSIETQRPPESDINMGGAGEED